MMLCYTSKFPLHFIGCVNESKIHRKGLSSRLAISSHNTIGVLGGVSAHSTVDFLEKLVKWSSECKPGNLPFVACNDPVLNKELSSCERSSSPYLSSRNIPYQFNESLIIENLRSKRLFLEQSGSRCIVMPCHVSHMWYNEVSRGCSVPFFHIGECVARELKEANLKPVEAGSNLRIGVIATEAILKSGFYQECKVKTGFDSAGYAELEGALPAPGDLAIEEPFVEPSLFEDQIADTFADQGFEVLVLDRATMEHTVFPAIEAFKKRDMEGARNLLRIALQVLLVKAVNTVILASTEFHGLLPPDDPLLDKCTNPIDSLVRSAIQWAKSTEEIG